jgi:hypothetical protein
MLYTRPIKSRSKVDQKSIKSRSKVDQKSIKSRSKVDQKSTEQNVNAPNFGFVRISGIPAVMTS